MGQGKTSSMNKQSHWHIKAALRYLVMAVAIATVTANAVEVPVSWSAPMTREDGTTLPPEEIGGYKMYLWVKGENVKTIDIAPTATSLIINELETLTTGLIAISATCTDTYGLESVQSNQVKFNIHAAKPPKIRLQWK